MKVVVLLVVVFAIPAAMVVLGVLLFRSAFVKRKPPASAPGGAAVPTAQIASGAGTPIRDPEQRSSAARAIGGMVLMGGGGAAIVALIKAISDLGNDHYSKGRLLRVRGTSQLPELAHGDGWHDDARPELAQLGELERRVLAEAWLVSARMEHASVAAFAQLSLHLAALGAPSELIERTHVAALDEIRHTRRCYALARGFGGLAYTAGPIAALAAPAEAGAAIDRTRLAIGTLVDGCIAEGIAADVTRAAARGAEDPVVRATLEMIARDEATHAELAWSVLAWCLDGGDAAVRDAVAARTARLDDELAERVPELPGVAPAWLAAHGLLDQDAIGALAAARIAATQTRARAMIARAA